AESFQCVRPPWFPHAVRCGGDRGRGGRPLPGNGPELIGRRATSVANNVYIIQIPCSTEHLEKVRRFVEDHAREAHLPPADVEECKLAADEACTNVIKHAYKCDTQQ